MCSSYGCIGYKFQPIKACTLPCVSQYVLNHRSISIRSDLQKQSRSWNRDGEHHHVQDFHGFKTYLHDAFCYYLKQCHQIIFLYPRFINYYDAKSII